MGTSVRPYFPLLTSIKYKNTAGSQAPPEGRFDQYIHIRNYPFPPTTFSVITSDQSPPSVSFKYES